MVLQWYAPGGELLDIRTVPHSNAPMAGNTPLHGLHGTFPGARVIGTPVPEHPAHPVKHRPSHRGCQRMRFLH